MTVFKKARTFVYRNARPLILPGGNTILRMAVKGLC